MTLVIHLCFTFSDTLGRKVMSLTTLVLIHHRRGEKYHYKHKSVEVRSRLFHQTLEN